MRHIWASLRENLSSGFLTRSYPNQLTQLKILTKKIEISLVASLDTVKPVSSGHSKRRPQLVFMTDYRLMQVRSIAECFIKLPFVFKTFVLSIFEWPLKAGFTIYGSVS